jgi:4-aminobutyrate aminotransferase-like enzyme/Ser/Thr protein kinase RdoA (MazF antagonist)
MDVTVHLAPRFDVAGAAALARDLFGLDAAARPLPSERDQNFHLVDRSGREFVLKIANAAEDPAILDFQNRAIAHLAAAGTTLSLPELVAANDGRVMSQAAGPDGRTHVVRLLTWVPGVELARVRPRNEPLLRSLGRRLADMDRALEGFAHPSMDRAIRWDLARAEWMRGEAGRIADPGLQAIVARVVDRFDAEIAPRLARLRTSVIHNDWNDHNVIVALGPGAPLEVAGVVDFGDMVRSHTICDLAIAATYAALGRPDPIGAAAAVVGGYHERLPIAEDEIALLFDLIVLRLCASVTMAACQQAAAPENEYLAVSQRDVPALLRRLAETPPEWALAVFRHACGLEPSVRGAALRRWLKAERGRFAPVVDADLSLGVVIDLGVTSAPRLHFESSSSALTPSIGRYDEARMLYAGDLYRREGNDGEVSRTVHLGIDLFAPAGTDIKAPLDGVVHSVGNNAAPLDYGPTIILEHRIDADPGVFYTLYGHLTLESIESRRPGDVVRRGERVGRLGTIDVNGGWPPHLHFQAIADLLGMRGDFPGVAAPEERDVWLSLCPNPEALLSIDEGRARAPRMFREELLRRRGERIGPSLSVSYRRPLTIVRGWRQFLYDDEGRRFLDAVNNVPHVGHSHPRVVRAAAEQLAILNTNTRYLHENLARYAERLTARLPHPLRVCYFVNSGSEANELALRLARAYTGRTDVVVIDAAYHGNTGALIDISPYKFDGPGGRGAPPWVHKSPMPDPYRGLHRGPDSGAAYAREVHAVVERLGAERGGVAAFFFEPLLSCGGQIVPPAGYLQGAVAAVREAGGVSVADEVQVGFGRVGTHFWGFETQGVVPDIVTLGKPIGNGFPLGAVVTTAEIAAAFANGMEYFSTFGGSPVACAVGLAVLDVMEEERLQERALDVGTYLLAGFRALKDRHPIVGDARGLGLFLGIELVRHPETRRPAGPQASYVVNRLRDRRVLTSTDGPDHNVIKIKPPMVFTREDADALVAALDAVLGEDPAR